MSTLKLSEAIRLGAMLGPQLRNGQTMSGDATCAIGSALLAVGIRDKGYSDVGEYFPIAYNDAIHPISGHLHILFGQIRLLNDHHHWTRERIADWVESIEREQDAKAEQPVLEAVPA